LQLAFKALMELCYCAVFVAWLFLPLYFFLMGAKKDSPETLAYPVYPVLLVFSQQQQFVSQ